MQRCSSAGTLPGWRATDPETERPSLHHRACNLDMGWGKGEEGHGVNSTAKEALVKIFKMRSGLLWAALIAPGGNTSLSADPPKIDIQNTRSFNGGPIDKSSVGSLRLEWEYLTTAET